MANLHPTAAALLSWNLLSASSVFGFAVYAPETTSLMMCPRHVLSWIKALSRLHPMMSPSDVMLSLRSVRAIDLSASLLSNRFPDGTKRGQSRGIPNLNR